MDADDEDEHEYEPDDVVDDLADLFDDVSEDDGFGGGEIDEGARVLTILWKGDVPPHAERLVAAARSRHGDAAVRVLPCDYSDAELGEEARRASLFVDETAGPGYSLSTHPEDDGSGIVVEVVPGSALLQDSPDDLRRRLGAGVPVRAVADPDAAEPWVPLDGS